jgi:fatty acid desaturase
MWVKIALGLAVLAGSWIALYALNPDSWKFVALYLLSGLAQTFLLLNIAHDSNHNAISSVRSVNKVLNYVFDVCGINSYMWRILHHRGHHSCINLHGEDDALTGRRIFRFTPHEPRSPCSGSSTSMHCSFTRCFLSIMFSEGLRVLFLPVPRISETHQTSGARIRHPLCG